MTHRRALVLCAVAAATLGLAGRSAPAPAAPLPDDPTGRVERLMVHVTGPTALDEYLARGFAVGDTTSKARRALDEAYAAVAARQARTRAYIEATGATIASVYDTAANAFLVHATPTQAEMVRRAPGARTVHPATLWSPDLTDAVPHVGAQAALDTLGLSGAGVRVAVIDTGIDYYHDALGGSGRVRDFDRDNPDSDEPGTFPTDKVVGGYDFAGTAYAANASAAEYREPKPDMDPRDQTGHGTHVAGIIAGVEAARWVSHGVAPEAELIALKVFGGIGGSTDLANDGIEWAIEANLGRPIQGRCRRDSRNLCRVDVLNMSLGADFASGIAEDAEFVRRATEAGILVVASAGNSGNVGYITGAPAASAHALSVASSLPPGQRVDRVRVTDGGTTRDVEALEAAADLSRPIAGGADVRAALAWMGRGCPGDSAGAVGGKVALIDGAACPYFDKLTAAQGAGAVAALVVSTSEALVRMTSATGRVAIPAFMIRDSDGAALQARLQTGAAIQVHMSDQFSESVEFAYFVDSLSSFSSRGPSRMGNLKPDISAPGSNIWAPRIGSGDQAMSQSGTSMAAPMVAGGAALVLERLRADGLASADRPLGSDGGLGPLDLGALLVNTAEPFVWAGDRRTGLTVGITRAGGGRMDVLRAARGHTLVRAGTIASVGFGYQAHDVPHETSRQATVRNLGPAEKRYRVEVASHEAAAVPGIELAASPGELVVPPGEARDVEVALRLEPADMDPWPVAGGERLADGAAGALDQAEVDAFLVVTEVDAAGTPVPGGDVARAPVQVLPRAASALRIAPEPLAVDTRTSRGGARLANTGEGGGRAELFALLGTDPSEADVAPRLDVESVGARLGEDGEGKRTIEIAVQTRAPRTIPQESQLQVLLDSNDDGTMDWIVHNTDPGLLLARPRHTGQQALVVRDVRAEKPLQLGNRISVVQGVDVDLHARVLVYRIPTAAIGIAAGAPVAVELVVRHVTTFADVRGDERTYRAHDAFPDDGWDGDGVGGGRVRFRPDRLPFDLEPWSVRADGNSEATFGVALRSGAEAPLARQVLAVFPTNLAGEGDVQVLGIESRDLPPTPTPGPSRTPGPTPTGGASPGPSATPTPTREPPASTLYLPAAVAGASR